ncbi:NADPH:quinone reductase-like Zn-dependent oxidoreductase [Catalinimonas alkaloidigena]|uniref:NAD(P)-dependent alcohol dehydrogenase n=1 Tax=Catalinimonas alkaloidigena TaxID=1075417 RepID=UPI002404D317|nr:NAD(P)-dependent alcohol dehydrogenase [Catalinimonas alkaloidigena]MDF9800983.1 NADPH:quinone reductase-like Zn-dependent oxidoreductase [Catalinimonas alkaloidigena]
MKASYHLKYGPPEVLSVREIEKPVPKDNELLIRVHAATVNRTDCGILGASPIVLRFITGLLKPKLPVTGSDFAGEVEAVGSKVSRFKIGDKVWGFNDQGISSHAEYMTIAEKQAILPLPTGFSYAQAAASVEGAHYAYNFINKVKLQAGQKAVVNGATGAIGSALLQLLKYHHIVVTAVCKSEHFETVKALGADKVIDYTQEDFTRDTNQYDYVMDAVGKSTFSKCKRLLKNKGIYISSELGPNNQNIFLPVITPLGGGKKVIFPFPISIEKSMDFISKLIEEGKFTPLIDERTFTLEEIREAFTYVGAGQKIGNVMLKVR